MEKPVLDGLVAQCRAQLADFERFVLAAAGVGGGRPGIPSAAAAAATRRRGRLRVLAAAVAATIAVAAAASAAPRATHCARLILAAAATAGLF